MNRWRRPHIISSVGITPLPFLARKHMHFFSRLFALALLLTGLASLNAQNPQPTVDDLKTLQKKFDVERAAAAAQKFPAHSLELSDQLAQRGRNALERNSPREAQRLYREAR